ncbi:hypothetical protein AB0K51_34750, partial [Kitasatospora sp. NPDC049285]|uniref:hypothetical protein n=1 Tax=Kitasatospora sp. NPDC049285 TaxID=3157096 RepID=UPI0034336513
AFEAHIQALAIYLNHPLRYPPHPHAAHHGTLQANPDNTRFPADLANTIDFWLPADFTPDSIATATIGLESTITAHSHSHTPPDPATLAAVRQHFWNRMETLEPLTPHQEDTLILARYTHGIEHLWLPRIHAANYTPDIIEHTYNELADTLKTLTHHGHPLPDATQHAALDHFWHRLEQLVPTNETDH